MTRYVAHLAGTSGSGKSTPLKFMYDNCMHKEYLGNPDGLGTDATWLVDHNIVVVGHYENQCGGCDAITGNGGLLRANDTVDRILLDPNFGDASIYLEGLLMASMPNCGKLKQICDIHNVPYLVVHCDPPAETCLARIYSRNNGKTIKEGNTTSRHHGLRKMMPMLIEAYGNIVIRWDTSQVPSVEDAYPTLYRLITGHLVNPWKGMEQYADLLHPA